MKFERGELGSVEQLRSGEKAISTVTAAIHVRDLSGDMNPTACKISIVDRKATSRFVDSAVEVS